MDAVSILNVIVQGLDAALIAFLAYGAYLAFAGWAKPGKAVPPEHGDIEESASFPDRAPRSLSEQGPGL